MLRSEDIDPEVRLTVGEATISECLPRVALECSTEYHAEDKHKEEFAPTKLLEHIQTLLALLEPVRCSRFRFFLTLSTFG